MKRLPVPPIPAETIEKIRLSIEAGSPQEAVFTQMRQLGLFMTDSIKLTHQLYGMSPTQAKIAVHYSDTWADCRESNDALHEAAFQAAKQLLFEESSGDQSPNQETTQLQNAS